jgi:Tol biopolymer transport system component
MNHASPRTTPLCLLVALAAGCGAHTMDPEASLDERIVFVRAKSQQDGPFPVGDAYSVRSDGSDERQLTSSGDVVFPAWSRHGTEIAFTRILAGVPEIWAMRADGSEPRRIVSGGIVPSWAPDGILLYTGSGDIFGANGNDGLHTVASDGSADRLIRKRAAFGSFSPDGIRIVYTSKVDGSDRVHNEIFTMDADGNNPTQLTFADDPDYPDANASSWSPDGRTIAFFCGHEGDLPPSQLGPFYEAGMQQVCVMNADGTNRHLLTNCIRCGSDNPGWSPDAKRVFFDRGVIGPPARISTFIIDLDGANEHELLDVSYGGGRLPWRAAR